VRSYGGPSPDERCRFLGVEGGLGAPLVRLPGFASSTFSTGCGVGWDRGDAGDGCDMMKTLESLLVLSCMVVVEESGVDR
jgi:hypothetical protein